MHRFRGAAVVGLISHVTLLSQRSRQLSCGLRDHAQELSLLWLCYPQGLPTSASSWRKGKAWKPRHHTSFPLTLHCLGLHHLATPDHKGGWEMCYRRTPRRRGHRFLVNGVAVSSTGVSFTGYVWLTLGVSRFTSTLYRVPSSQGIRGKCSSE